MVEAAKVDARGEVVLQRYLPNPCLWKGRKLQYRAYAVWRGRRCFLYRGAMAQVCATPYFHRAEIPPMGRGGAAAATLIFRGDESRRRRGCHSVEASEIDLGETKPVWAGKLRRWIAALVISRTLCRYAKPEAGSPLDATVHVTNVSVNEDARAFVPERPVPDLQEAAPTHFRAMARVLRSLARAAAPALSPKRGRFELVGVDFLCDDDGQNPHAWLVERRDRAKLSKR